MDRPTEVFNTLFFSKSGFRDLRSLNFRDVNLFAVDIVLQPNRSVGYMDLCA
jgi:hypothetical protein